MAVQQWKVEQPDLWVSGVLLEGPIYDHRTDEVHFIDIDQQFVYTYDAKKGAESLKKFHIDEPIGVVCPIAGSDDFIVGVKYGIARLSKDGNLTYIHRYWKEDEAHKQELMRSNDGAVDPEGRFWIGAMTDHRVKGEIKPEGMLFRQDHDGSLHRVLENVYTPNGIGWSPGGDIFYWTDSPPQNIYAFDFDAKTGAISNKRVFYHVAEPNIHPDGLAVDAEGNVWSALWGGYKVLKISPRGEVIGEVNVPNKFVTCPAFVGTRLVITTAQDSEVKGELERGGHVFSVDVGVTGVPKPECKLSSASMSTIP